MPFKKLRQDKQTANAHGDGREALSWLMHCILVEQAIPMPVALLNNLRVLFIQKVQQRLAEQVSVSSRLLKPARGCKCTAKSPSACADAPH